MIAYHTLISVRKILTSKQPSYLADRMPFSRHGRELRNCGGPFVTIPNYKLDVSRAGFIYRGSKLFNSLPRELREEESIGKFKIQVKDWVKQSIPIRPR